MRNVITTYFLTLITKCYTNVTVAPGTEAADVTFKSKIAYVVWDAKSCVAMLFYT